MKKIECKIYDVVRVKRPKQKESFGITQTNITMRTKPNTFYDLIIGGFIQDTLDLFHNSKEFLYNQYIDMDLFDENVNCIKKFIDKTNKPKDRFIFRRKDMYCMLYNIVSVNISECLGVTGVKSKRIEMKDNKNNMYTIILNGHDSSIEMQTNTIELQIPESSLKEEYVA